MGTILFTLFWSLMSVGTLLGFLVHGFSTGTSRPLTQVVVWSVLWPIPLSRYLWRKLSD